jgi:hypothetical protein
MLLEFKNLMSQKTETRYIKTLKRTIILLGIILITLVSINFSEAS